MGTAELTYYEKDGLVYPNIQLEEEEVNLTQLGKYGIMAWNYLKENEPQRYRTLCRMGVLEEKSREVEEEANDMLELLMKQYLGKHKPKDSASTMEMWQLMEQAKMYAEEIVVREVVFKIY